jgi:hypothetical protein
VVGIYGREKEDHYEKKEEPLKFVFAPQFTEMVFSLRCVSNP